MTQRLFRFVVYTLLPLGGGWMGGSCSDMLETDSELVEFQEDNQLKSPTDSVYSVMGIIYKLQALADRTVLLGEVRADLVSPTAYANADLKALARQEAPAGQNRYNQISDYYAVVNNCNYYLAMVDTALQKRGQRVFEAEYAAVKTFRAWTYLQMALVYGRVPLVTEPLLTENEAAEAMKLEPRDIVQLCNFFIDDLLPYVDTKLPQYGNIYNQNAQKFFIPLRLLLGDLCLWAGRYQEAATFYHDYLTLRTNPITTGTSRVQWSTQTNDFRTVWRGLSSTLAQGSSSECLCYVPMESSYYDGVKSQLTNTFNSTQANNYYVQLSPSQAMISLSASQNYCMRYVVSDAQTDTLYAPKTNLLEPYEQGDLRLYDAYRTSVVNQDRNSKYSADRQTISKLNADGITLYRRNVVYLRFAEALNRAGYPQSAFAVLKYGLYEKSIADHVDSTEHAQAGALLDFDLNVFTEQNTLGIHSRGCGDADADTLYVLPQPTQSLASRADTVAWQQPLVEDFIINEMALETAFEGHRFYDLMRVALRRGDAAYLAEPIARRGGDRDATLYSKLTDVTNWYLEK